MSKAIVFDLTSDMKRLRMQRLTRKLGRISGALQWAIAGIGLIGFIALLSVPQASLLLQSAICFITGG